MKIAHLSDIHYHLQVLEAILNSEEVASSDVIAISGDILNRPKEEDSKRLTLEEKTKSTIIERWRREFKYLEKGKRNSLDIRSEMDYMDWVTKSFPEDKDVREFSESQRVIKRICETYYEKIREALETTKGTKLAVPGNWDTIDFFEQLKKFDLHKKRVVIQDLLFLGWGGTEYNCNAFRRPGPTLDENAMHESLLKEKPDIIITHTPPRKMTDKGNTSGSLLGSSLLRSYIFEAYVEGKAPVLVLSGHSHSPKIEKLVTGTIVSNPGNVGIECREPYGTFNIIELNGREVTRGETFVYIKKKIKRLNEEKNAWKERVSDENAPPKKSYPVHITWSLPSKV